jgi:uncharacterized protein YuzE
MLKIPYYILKGYHFSIHLIKFYLVRKDKPFTISTSLKFTNSCLYKFNTKDDFAVNKLFGINYGFDKHQNSDRFGWNCESYSSLTNTIDIFVYQYRDGRRSFEKIFNAELNELYYFEISKTGNIINFEIYDEDDSLVAQFNSTFDIDKKTILSYKQYPYFGGVRTAPHNIKIKTS